MSRRPAKFEIAKGEEYQKPLKYAQKYCYTFMKKDKKTKQYLDDYKEYYALLADTSNKVGQYLFLNEDYRKAASSYKYISRAVPQDPILLLWQGISEVKSKNSVEGDKHILAALERIDENFVPSKVTAGVLAHGMLLIDEYLTQIGKTDEARKAKKLVEVFKKYDPDELDKKKMDERKAKTIADGKVMRKFYSNEEQDEEIKE